MKSNVKLVLVGVVAFGTSACAGVGGATRGGVVELRGMTAVRTDSPRLIAAGPARLLHVDVHGRREVDLYRAVRKTGTDADCLGANRGQGRPLHEDRRTPVEVEIPDGEVVCLAAATTGPGLVGREIEVSWHARRETGMPTGALAFDADHR